jgi:hypothetical protein
MDKVDPDKMRAGDILKDPDGKFSAYVDSEFKRRKPGKKKVLIGSLTLTMVPQEAYGTHCSNFYQLGRDHPKYDFAFVSPRRMAIDGMRNLCVKLAILGNFDYLYFFDDDTVNDRDVLGRLLPRMKEFNAISAGYFVRGYPFDPMVFRWIDPVDKSKSMRLYKWNEYKRFTDKDKVLRKHVCGVGCGCTLFRVEDFKKISYPWFQTGLHNTEDAFWFFRAATELESYKVGMDFNIDCGHLCSPIYVDQSNVNTVRRYHRELHKVGGLI